MSALTILVMRHAEKQNDPDLGPGLTEQGAHDAHSLVVRGWQRAGTWAALFGPRTSDDDYPTPHIVYAAAPNRQQTPDGSVSRRPYETVLPLCERLSITPVTTYGVGDEVALVNAVRQLTGVVLICWEHKRIAKAIVPELAKGQTLPQLPSQWDGTRFDVVLRFDRAENDAQWSFRQLFPRLLNGDSAIPLSNKE